MDHVYRATFHDGAFVPTETPDLPPGSEVELVVRVLPDEPDSGKTVANDDPAALGTRRAQPQDGSCVEGPQATDPEERARLLSEVVESMRRNPVPVNAPRFTREELHERR